MEAAVRVLREKCLFTAEQLTEVLQSCPGVLLEEPGSLQYHFQVRGVRVGAVGTARHRGRVLMPLVPLAVRVLQDGRPPEGDGQGASLPNALR